LVLENTCIELGSYKGIALLAERALGGTYAYVGAAGFLVKLDATCILVTSSMMDAMILVVLTGEMRNLMREQVCSCVKVKEIFGVNVEGRKNKRKKEIELTKSFLTQRPVY
jgi:hypothetical protein